MTVGKIFRQPHSAYTSPAAPPALNSKSPEKNKLLGVSLLRLEGVLDIHNLTWPHFGSLLPQLPTRVVGNMHEQIKRNEAKTLLEKRVSQGLSKGEVVVSFRLFKFCW